VSVLCAIESVLRPAERAARVGGRGHGIVEGRVQNVAGVEGDCGIGSLTEIDGCDARA
jgi:hypothetical protein